MIIYVIQKKKTFQESLPDETTSTHVSVALNLSLVAALNPFSFRDIAHLGRLEERKRACGAVGYMAASIVANSPLEDLLWL